MVPRGHDPGSARPSGANERRAEDATVSMGVDDGGPAGARKLSRKRDIWRAPRYVSERQEVWRALRTRLAGVVVFQASRSRE